jgi:hypothetical protein
MTSHRNSLQVWVDAVVDVHSFWGKHRINDTTSPAFSNTISQHPAQPDAPFTFQLLLIVVLNRSFIMNPNLPTYNRFTDLGWYNHVLVSDMEQLEDDVRQRPLSEIIEMYRDIRLTLILTNRLLNFVAAGVGYFSIVIFQIILVGLTPKVILFINISMLVFPLYCWLTFDIKNTRSRNLQIRKILVTYKHMLSRVITERRKVSP